MSGSPKSLPIDTETATSDDAVGRARDSLEATLSSLKLTPEEEAAMAPQLGRLRELSQKLDETTIEIVAFGMVSRGKSSVLNALLGLDLFEVGATHGTTDRRSIQEWADPATGEERAGGPRLVLVDTPGIDEVGGDVREAEAREAARRADLILFIIAGDMQRVELDALAELRKHQKPIILVFNQIDRYPDADREAIHAKLEDERVKGLIHPEDIILCAARPDPVPVKIRQADGSTKTVMERPEPIIEPLKIRILDVMEREGKALVALNTLLLAGDIHEEIVQRKLRLRDEAARRLIWNYAMVKGAAVALNPVPVADLAGGLAVDVSMVYALGQLYGFSMTRSAAAGLVKDMSIAFGVMGLVQLAARLARSGIKGAMAGLTVMSGGLAAPLTALVYGTIGLTQAAAGASASYIIGKGAVTYLSQGGQWGPKGVKTVIHEIMAEAKDDSIVDRLREDLKAQLDQKRKSS